MTTATIATPSRGAHRSVPFRDYLRWPLMSQSILKQGRASMAHLKAAMDGYAKEPTDDMLLGSALDVTYLEPELMPDHVVKWDRKNKAGKPMPRKGKEWDAFCAEHDGKIILTEAMYAKLVGMVQSLRRHPQVRRWQNQIEDVQVSYVGELCGVPMKCRIDALTPDPLIDLKKVSSGDIRAMERTIYTFGYHIQAYVYTQIVRRDRMLLATVEDSPPYDVVMFELDDDWMALGKSDTEGLLSGYRLCKHAGKWPGRSDEIVPLSVPKWLQGAVEIELDGETVKL